MSAVYLIAEEDSDCVINTHSVAQSYSENTLCVDTQVTHDNREFKLPDHTTILIRSYPLNVKEHVTLMSFP